MNPTVSKLQKLCIDTECHAIFLLNSSLIKRVVGESPEQAVLVVFPDTFKLVSSYMNKHLLTGMPEENIVFSDSLVWVDALMEIAARDCERVGFDPFRTVSAFQILADSQLELHWIDLSEELTTAISVKPQNEIKKISKAVHVTEYAISDVMAGLKDGVSEAETAKMLNISLMEQTGESPAFPAMVAFGANTANPHWLSGERTLKPGDIITVDCGASLKGQRADIARTFFWRDADDLQLQRHRCLKETMSLLINHIQPGVSGRELATLCMSHLRKVNLHKHCPYPIGHGIGFEVHEYPAITLDSEDVLMIDMVFCLEPGIFIPNWGAVRVEDVYHLSKEGVIKLGSGASMPPVLG